MGIKLGKQREWVKTLALKQKLVPLLEKAIDADEFAWEAKFEVKGKDDAWHPSGDCTPSLHDLWRKANGESLFRPPSMSLRKTFAVGHFWHAYLQWIAVEKADICGWEDIERRGMKAWGPYPAGMGPDGDLPLPANYGALPYHWATGSMDLCPAFIPGEGEFVVDFKTQGSHDFRQMHLPAWCADKYEAQVNIYMDWADTERALIVCINKDSPHDFKEYEYQRNDALIDAIYTKWKLVAACLDEGIEPPQDEDIPLPTRGAV